MFVGTHALAPLVACGVANIFSVELGRKPLFTNKELCVIALAGASPDILWPHLSLAARLSSPTHTAWYFLATFPLFLWACMRWFPERPFRVTAAMSFGVALHLFADAIAGGIAWLYPVSKTPIGVRLIPYQLWLYSDLLFAALTVVVVAWVAIRNQRATVVRQSVSKDTTPPR